MSELPRCDDNHVGHFFYKYMRTHPDDICQIDAATGEQETRRSVLSRSIRLARSFQKYGLQPGDVVVLGGKNHLDLHIPFYAALMTGLPLAGVDPLFKYHEIKQFFSIVQPKLAFCECEMLEEYQRAAQDLGLDTKLVTFGQGDCTMQKFMEIYVDSRPEEEFEVATFNTDNVHCWLLSTSGTTGYPKVVALMHSHVLRSIRFLGIVNGERRPALYLSSIQWISASYSALIMPINHIKLQTSAPVITEHVIDIINKYKPATTMTTPTLLSLIVRHERPCDLTCFQDVRIVGSKLHKELLNSLKDRLHKDALILQGYGQTENGGIVLQPCLDGPFGNIGKPMPDFKLKIVDPSTGRVIEEPNVPGELWTKGPRMACYYSNPEATAAAFSQDGYYKTGDLVYRDENDYYFFVDRIKMLLKYKNYQVIPPEVEEVILTLEGVEDVCVTGVPHPDYGDLVVACVVRKSGAKVSAQEIKDHVARHLSPYKQLHGGVVFLDELPLTSSGKLARVKVKELALVADRI